MHVVQHEVHSTCALENELHVDYEWMVDLKHDQLFEVDAFDSVLFEDHIFPYTLQSVVFLSDWKIRKVNFAESASSHD